MKASAPGQPPECEPGWSDRRIGEAIRHAPLLFVCHPDRLQGTVDWFLSDEYTGGDVAVMHKVAASLRSNPSVLMASLHFRLRPRHAYAMQHRQQWCPPAALFSLTDERFCKKIGGSVLELKEFKQKHEATYCSIVTETAEEADV